MKLFSFICVLVLSTFAHSNNAEHEIKYLKQFIQTSDCQFNRNGDIHSAPEALKHIEKKYQYFKDDITSAEMFIEKSASKSTYRVNITLSPAPQKMACKHSVVKHGYYVPCLISVIKFNRISRSQP